MPCILKCGCIFQNEDRSAFEHMLEKGEEMEIPVTYRGKEHLFSFHMVRMGYTYKIFVQMDKHQIIFEPDEERNLRAVTDSDLIRSSVDIGLIKAIGEALENSLR